MPSWGGGGTPRLSGGNPRSKRVRAFPTLSPLSEPLGEDASRKKGEIPIDGTGTGCRNPCGAAPQRGRGRGRAARCGLRGSVRPPRFGPVRVQPRV